MTEEANNIVLFPKQNTRPMSPEETIEDVKESLRELRLVKIAESSSIATEYLFENLKILGFDFESNPDPYAKDLALFVESLRSLLYKYYDIEHPMQQIAAGIFVKEKDGTLSYAKAKEEKK